MGKPRARPKAKPATTRRTSGQRTQGRSARVVQRVLQTVAEELGRHGYAELRVEDVAQHSAVHKTTIYRRWPTKAELVAAAIRHFADSSPSPPSSGSLRSDVIAMLERMVARVQTPGGMGIVRTIQLERFNPDLEAVTREIKQQQWQRRRNVIEQGVARGELPHGVDVDLVAELLFAPVLRRITQLQQPADGRFIRNAVDLVLAGAAVSRSRGARRPVGGAPAARQRRLGARRAR